jgi:putative spermidine/putrescine transport system permease protein
MAGLIARRARKQAAFRWIVLVVLGVFFVLPLIAMVEFTTRGDQQTWSLLVDWPQLSETYPDLAEGIVA